MKRIGRCPNCGSPLYEKDKKSFDILGTKEGKRKVMEIKIYYDCQKCGESVYESEVRK